jgi:branched-subunit amino acid transport protein
VPPRSAKVSLWAKHTFSKLIYAGIVTGIMRTAATELIDTASIPTSICRRFMRHSALVTTAIISAAIISADTTSADTILVAIITGTTTRSASSVEIRSRMRGQLPLPKRFAMQADRAAHQRYVCATTSLN